MKAIKIMLGGMLSFYAVGAVLGYLNGWGMWADDYVPPAKPAPVDQAAHDAKRREEFKRFDAAAVCQTSITDALNDPGSADFDPLHTWRLTENSDTVWTVYPTLRAKNAFGAMIHTGFACQIQLTGEQWSLLALEETK